MNTVFVILIAYILGSIPTANIVSRLLFQEDLRMKGSGNVGTFNFLRVTHSRILALPVLLIDAGKGSAAMLISGSLLGEELLIFPALAVILGHIFSIWLKGKGGRGLATLAGVFLYLKPLAVAGWLVIFTMVYRISKRYILAGVSALILVNLIIAFSFEHYLFLISSTCSLVVIVKYLPRLRQEWST